MIGKAIYNLLVQQGKNPVEILRSLSFEFPDEIDITDIDHKVRTGSSTFATGIDQYIETKPDKKREKIHLSDGCETECFYISDNNIYLKNGICVGEYNYWIDDEMDIPPKYKNKDNIVINPETDELLMEYFLYSSSNMYHELNTDMLYKEFKYDYGLDTLLRITAINKNKLAKNSVN